MKKRLIFTILLIIAGYAGYFYYTHLPQKVTDKLTLFGNVEIRQVDMGFRVEGKIQNMFFEEGDYVKKGQLLATLDSSRYRADYEKSIADINMNRHLNVNASKKLSRNLPLCAEGTVSKQDCDDYKSAKDTSGSAIQAAVASSKVAKKNLSDSRIYAPADGIITTRAQEPGAVVAADQNIYTMAKMKPVWIRTYVSEKDLGNVRYNMRAKVFIDAVNPDTGKKRQYQGFVGYISPVAEFTPKTVQTEDLRTDLVYRIRVYVYDIDEYLRQGMPVTVEIQLGKKGNNAKHNSGKKSYKNV
jgi:HlyD family secretion protein